MHEIVTAANQKFMDVFAKGAATMDDLYTSDAQILPPGNEAISGADAIGSFWKGAYNMGVKRAKLETVEAEPAGDTIIEVGNFTLYGADESELDKGKYIVVWKQEAGRWKLHRDIWNTSKASN